MSRCTPRKVLTVNTHAYQVFALKVISNYAGFVDDQKNHGQNGHSPKGSIKEKAEITQLNTSLILEKKPLSLSFAL